MAQNRMRLPCVAFRLGYFPLDAKLPEGGRLVRGEDGAENGED